MYHKKGELPTSQSYDYYMRVDLSSYVGEWVAICDEKIVTHKPTFKEAYEEAVRSCPGKRPLMSKVPSGEILIL